MPDLTASPGRAPPGPMPNNQNAGGMQQRQGVKEPVLLQGDFRKVSGISSEIFRQIEAVENDHDPSTAAALEVSIFRTFSPFMLIIFLVEFKIYRQLRGVVK